MKKLLVLICATASFSMATGIAVADSIEGKMGVTGRIGILFPSDGEFGSNKSGTDSGIIAGGGLIYGIDKHFAAEFDITHSMFDSDIGDFNVTDVALGAQYRFILDQPRLVPYVGGGLDLLISDLDHGRNVDTTVGAHASGGIDYFITKQWALTAEARIVVAPDADINGSSGEQGSFDPTSVSTTLGVRYFFN